MTAPGDNINREQLPQSIQHSKILDQADQELLCQVPEIPDIDPAYEDPELTPIIQYFSITPEEMEKELHRLAKKHLAAGKTAQAWQVLLAAY